MLHSSGSSGPESESIDTALMTKACREEEKQVGAKIKIKVVEDRGHSGPSKASCLARQLELPW